MRERLLEIRSRIEEYFRERAEREGDVFLSRYDAGALDVARQLYPLYQSHPDWPECLASILMSAAEAFHDRDERGRARDLRRKADKGWYLRPEVVFGVHDLGLWGDRLDDLGRRAEYLRDLGITHLRVVPVFCAYNQAGGFWRGAQGFRDPGGEPSIIMPLRAAAKQLDARGIGMGLDFVLNHIAEAHPWASKARHGDPYYRRFFLTYPDRAVPDEVEESLRGLGPDPGPGRFSFDPALEAWVWTTFSPGSWDLNYANPWVFRQILEELLVLGNAGVDFLTLRELRFIWKRPGTSCQDLPEVLSILGAVAGLVCMAAPGMALVAGDGPGEGEAGSYLGGTGLRIANSERLPPALWAGLGMGDGRWVRAAMERDADPGGGAFMASLADREGLRWPFSSGLGARFGLGVNEARRWMVEFYSGRAEGSFAGGRLLSESQRVPVEARVAGRAAALVGLSGGPEGHPGGEMALRRLLLLYSILLSIGALPQLVVGDEIGLIGEEGPAVEGARPEGAGRAPRSLNLDRIVERRHDPSTVEGSVYSRLRHLIWLRKRVAAFSAGKAVFVHAGGKAVLGYLRNGSARRVLCLSNLSDREQRVAADILEMASLGGAAKDLVTGEPVRDNVDLLLAPYQFVWISDEGVDGERRSGGE